MAEIRIIKSDGDLITVIKIFKKLYRMLVAKELKIKALLYLEQQIYQLIF